MPELSNTPRAAHQISLFLHTAVDSGLDSGVGISIIQSTAPGMGLSFTLPTEEQAHGIERSQARAKNIKTPERAHMFALILAMWLARSTIRRKCTGTGIKVQSVAVLCRLPAVVELIEHHQAHGLESLESVVSKEDRSMIRRVLARARRLSRYDVQVTIAEDGAEGDIVKATRAKMIASHRKKRPLRRLRHERQIMSRNA